MSTSTPRGSFTAAEARSVADRLGIRLEGSPFDLEAFRRGMDVELEHGRRDPDTNVTDDDPLVTGRIAWAHLKERPDYYELLVELESAPPRA